MPKICVFERSHKSGRKWESFVNFEVERIPAVGEFLAVPPDEKDNTFLRVVSVVLCTNEIRPQWPAEIYAVRVSHTVGQDEAEALADLSMISSP